MRSLFGPASAEEPSAPQVIASAPSEEPAESPSPPPPGPELPLQNRLFSATERLAVALVERAEEEMLAKPAPGKEPPSLKELMAALAMAQDFLVKLPKLRPEDEEKDGAGVDALRQMMADPVLVVERLQANPKFITALKARGWLPPPVRPAHRPTKEQAADREAYAQRQRETAEDADEDDSELQNMLKGMPK